MIFLFDKWHVIGIAVDLNDHEILVRILFAVVMHEPISEYLSLFYRLYYQLKRDASLSNESLVFCIIPIKHVYLDNR